MKTAVLFLVTLAVMVLPSSSFGQLPVPTRPGPLRELTFMKFSPSNFNPLMVTNGPVSSTNSSPRLFGTNRPQVLRLLRTHRRPSGQLAPGVYETAPYTCIVVVPGQHLDDGMIFGGQRVGTNALAPRMPMVRPELRFIPRGKP